MKKINRETPKGLQLNLIVDNYTAHKHPAAKKLLIQLPRFHMHVTPRSCSLINIVEQLFRDITFFFCVGSFSATRELASPITTSLALHNAQPKRYVWSAKGEKILRKIQRARVRDGIKAQESAFFEMDTLLKKQYSADVMTDRYSELHHQLATRKISGRSSIHPKKSFNHRKPSTYSHGM